MSEGIPDHIDLMRAAKLGSQYQGAIRLARMHRLSELLAEKSGQIDIDVQFGINDDHHSYLAGRACGQLSLPCQRCMQPLTEDIDVTFELVLVESEYQSQQLDEDIDVLVVDTIPASFIDIVEDELLLGFPAVYMHEADACSATPYMQDKREIQTNEKGAEKNNPFDVLKDLKLDG